VTVQVLLFAGLREQLGTDSVQRSVSPGTTVAELYASLFPSGPEGRLPVLYAMDQEYVPGSTPVRDGAEVALLPPLGGG
jgi:molybdopterin converting factor subunit 1